MFTVVGGFVAAAAVTLASGMWLVTWTERGSVDRGRTTSDAESKKTRLDPIRAFKALDLGPDPVLWPSQVPWRLQSTLKVPEWPSSGWDDEHFGKHRAPQATPAPVPKPAVTKGEKARRKAKASEQPAQPMPPPVQLSVQTPVSLRVSGSGPPDEAELEHLVQTEGLAETVNVIMRRTGWEFREAAQYLAKLRQKS